MFQLHSLTTSACLLSPHLCPLQGGGAGAWAGGGAPDPRRVPAAAAGPGGGRRRRRGAGRQVPERHSAAPGWLLAVLPGGANPQLQAVLIAARPASAVCRPLHGALPRGDQQLLKQALERQQGEFGWALPVPALGARPARRHRRRSAWSSVAWAPPTATESLSQQRECSPAPPHLLPAAGMRRSLCRTRAPCTRAGAASGTACLRRPAAARCEGADGGDASRLVFSGLQLGFPAAARLPPLCQALPASAAQARHAASMEQLEAMPQKCLQARYRQRLCCWPVGPRGQLSMPQA